MPNYGLVVTPTYNPMSYEQYIQPFQDYAQVYNATVDQIDALEMEANQWERLADSDIDAPQYQQYKSYADDLRKYADELATQGLSSRTRAGLSRMRQRYAKEIKPIEDAYNRREEEIKFQREARLKDPDVIFSRDASSTALGRYMSSMPELQNYSGRMLQAYSAEASKQLAKQIRENPRQWKSILGGQYFETADITGLTDAEILATIANSPNGNAALRAIGEQVLGMSGMDKWNEWSPELQARVNSYIENGYWQAIGETKFDNLSNKYYDFLMKQKEKDGDSNLHRKPVERTRQEITNPNPKAVKEYRDIYKNFTTPLSDEVKNYRGVNTPSELMEAYTKYTSQASQRKEQLIAQLGQNGITNTENKMFGSWVAPTVKLTEEEEKALINEIRSRKHDYTSSDNTVKGYIEYTREENQIKNKKFQDNINTIEEVRNLQNSIDSWENDVKKYKLSDKDKETLEALGVSEEQFYKNPLSAENLLWEDTLTYLDASNEAGTTFRNEVLGGIRRNLLNKEGIDIKEVRNKKGKNAKVKDKDIQTLLANDNIVGMMIDPVTLQEEALTIQSKDGFYSLPLRYLDANVLQALKSPKFVLNSNGKFEVEGTPNTSLLDAWKLCFKNKQYELAHQIEVQIADEISSQYNYNFYQRQGNVNNEE